MKNKGFTLIELLAVIVILAIIALIAAPIVLNIISDTKESASLRSAEFYLDAVEIAVAQSKLNGVNIGEEPYPVMENGDVCIGTLDAEKNCIGENGTNNPKDILEVEINGDVPDVGSTVTIGNGKVVEVELKYGTDTIVKKDGKLEFGESSNGNESVCTLAANGDIAPEGISEGDKYNCIVDPNKPAYTFYVLAQNSDGTTNLIMDQNVNSDGTPAGTIGITRNGDNVYNIVAWNSEDGQGTNEYGPVTAIKFLYNATKNWTNVEPLTYTYSDKEFQGGSYGYTSFISINGLATITSAEENIISINSQNEPALRARLPIYSSDPEKTEVSNLQASKEYLYINLYENDGIPVGYWTLSSRTKTNEYSYVLGAESESIEGVIAYTDVMIGVRPVITVKM